MEFMVINTGSAPPANQEANRATPLCGPGKNPAGRQNDTNPPTVSTTCLRVGPVDRSRDPRATVLQEVCHRSNHAARTQTALLALSTADSLG